MLPIERLGHQRHDRRAPSAEKHRVDRHPDRVLPLGRDRRILGRWGREAGIRVRRRRVGLGRPVVAVPVDQVRRLLLGHALPPDVAVVGPGAVGEDRVGLDRADRVRIGVLAGARRHAEEASLGIDRVQPPVRAELHPRDVIADRLDRPALERGDQHRQVGLAAGTRKGARDELRPRPLGRSA